MRALLVIGLSLFAARAGAKTAATAAHATATTAAAAADDEPPGEKEFTGCKKYPEGKRFRWSVRGEASVPELVASMGEIGCLAIVLGPQLAQRAGKVSLEVPDLMTASEVYRMFYSALEVVGLTVENTGSVLKIVDAGRGREVARVLGEGPTPHGDEFVTRLIRIEHARPQELAELLGRLKSKDGDVATYAAGPALIVTDRGSHVRRMEELVLRLDVARPGERTWTVATHAQNASELAATLEKILTATRRSDAPGGETRGATTALADGVAAVVPVDAAHLIVVVGREDGFRRVLALATRIDPPVVEDAGQSHVIYLEHTNAEDIAGTLQSLGLAARGGPATGGGAPRTPAPGSPAGALGLQGDVRIGADKVANAIVVFAGGADFVAVRDLIAKLDVPRRQVYVEATILDVSADRARTLGLAFHGGTPVAGGAANGFIAQGSSSFNSVSVDAAGLARSLGTGGLIAGLLGTSSFNVAGMSVPSIGVILQALEHHKDVSVLSRPHLLTMDNAKATLTVGQTFPYLASQTTSVATGAAFGTYARQEVNLKLELTPHLNDSDSVRLEIDGEISDAPDGLATTNPGGPVTNKRTLKTAIVVRDGETVVLGGLQKESESDSIDKVPILGDIPVLGRLFQMRSKTRLKQDLLIVLTPYVIRGPEDLRRIHERKAQEEREFVERSTAFSEFAYDAHVDYRRKRGLLEEINQSALAAEREAAALHRAERALRPPAAAEEVR